MSTSDPRFPARFDPEAWATDRARSTPAGRIAAETARHDYEQNGIPQSHLRPCEPEGRTGINLPDCAKVYVPHPNGRWGIVFRAILLDGRFELRHLAFGVRHHPRGSHALDVYDIAGARLLEITARDLRARGPGTPAPPAQEEG